jgi:hypothetical protein
MADDMTDRPHNGPRLQVTLALLALGFFLMEGFQTFQLIRENGNLAKMRESQEPTVLEGQRVRTLLEVLVSKTTELADGGDASAKAVLDDLRQQGVVFKQSPKPADAPAVPAATPAPSVPAPH